jgi:Xaa-Pro dipeptidase
MTVVADMALDARLDRLAEEARRAGLDVLLLTSDASIAYVTGFRPVQLERFFGVAVHASGEGALVVPRLDEGQVVDVPARLDRVVYEAGSSGVPELVHALGHPPAVGVEEDHLVFGRAQALVESGLELVPAAEIVRRLRARKDEAEIARVRDACALVAEALMRAFDELRPGDIERGVNARVEGWLREQGAEDVHSLILFGAHAADPHGQPGERVLEPGDVVCADVSACLDGYWGDLTRCAGVRPTSEWAQAAWLVVRDAQAGALDALRAGMRAEDVDAAQRRIVEAAPHLGSCIHGAGHAIGLEVHEPPFLVPGNETILEEGMIFTVEPGLYRRDTGGVRLEDDVLVTRGRPEFLSTLPLALREIPT